MRQETVDITFRDNGCKPDVENNDTLQNDFLLLRGFVTKFWTGK